MADERSFMDWSAGWVIEDGVLIWRLTLEFEEDGVKLAKTQIDCVPNPKLIAKLNRRANQGLAFLTEGVIRECVRGAVDGIQHQLLTEDGTAENRLAIDLGKGMAAYVWVRSQRLGAYDGNDKVLYLKEVPRIIVHLQEEARASLSPSQRRRMHQFYRSKRRKHPIEPKSPEPVPLTLSEEDPYHFYVDESGDTGFKDGSSEYYTVAFIAILQSEKRALEARLRKILQQHMPPGKNEIKFSDVDRYAEPRKTALYNECIASLRQAPLVLYAIAVHKDGFVFEKVRSLMADYYYGGESLPDLAGPFAPESMKEYPKELLRDWGAGILPSVMMRRMIEEGRAGRVFYDRAQWDWKNQLLKEGFQEVLRLAPRAAEVFFGVRCDIQMPLFLPHSHEEPILWLAELAAREVNKLMLGMPSRIDDIAPAFAGAGPFPDGHFVALVDKHGRYTFYNLITKRIDLVLPD